MIKVRTTDAWMNIALCRNFTAGHLSAQVVPRTTLDDDWTWPRMKPAWARELRGAIARAAVYVVFSYGTPIAWLVPGEEQWSIPAVWYSQTTTRHQNIARRAVAAARQQVNEERSAATCSA